MRQGRRSKHSILSAEAHASHRDKKGGAVPFQPAESFAMASAASSCDETDLWRQARRWRQEWRQNRYSRFKTA